MSIPHFKSNHDWEAFTQIFDSQWHCKLALLNRVKDDMFPGYDWHSLTPKSIETINDIVTNLLYDVDRKFKETHQDYKTEDDELFIPYRSFKENVTEALKEAMPCALEKHNQEVLAKLECHPCDTLACADHLTDE
jgi:hypothetical protein